jgi:hypothetical protein
MVLEHKNNLKAAPEINETFQVEGSNRLARLHWKSEVHVANLFQGAANVMAQKIRNFRAERAVYAR